MQSNQNLLATLMVLWKAFRIHISVSPSESVGVKVSFYYDIVSVKEAKAQVDC